MHRAHLHAAAEAGADLIVEEVVAWFDGQTITSIRSRLATSQGASTVDPEPIACIEIARELERTAHTRQRDYIRNAREAGRSWCEIGQALDLFWEGIVAKESIADMAYDYALRYDASAKSQPYTWTCSACQQTITDNGPWPPVPPRKKITTPRASAGTAV